jgi:hypothetical protein
MTVSPTQSGIMTALRTFLLAVLPDGVDVIQAVDNRVPEPAGTEFVIMSQPRFARLRTNVDSAADVKFTAAIDDTDMTVTAVAFGAIAAGATVFGSGVAAGTRVVSGPGGVGDYVIEPSQTVASRTMSSGAKSLEQGVEVTIQLDFHSASGASANMAQTVATTLRDEYGVQQFAEQDPNYDVVPLYADDPRFMPFVNENAQSEWRWVLDVCLQANQIASVPQQYADSVEVELVSVDATYPPA